MPSIMNYFFNKNRHSRTNVLLFGILALSAFFHLWNPIGFPYFHGDEGHYMRRSVHIIEGLGAQEQRNTTWSFEPRYDHPYFGQIFLGSILAMSGYPSSQNNLHSSTYSASPLTSSDETFLQSIETLHLIPRIIMGVLAIVDTFLIYKIAELRYNRNVALIAALLFAVMPMSWFVRRMVLESLLLPILLLSILFACAPKNQEGGSYRNRNLPIITSTISGIFLGLAIFTKIPAFTMIPLVAYLIYTNSDKKLKALGFWFIPVFLIPVIWPANAIFANDFDQWWHDTLLQATREGRGLILSIMATFRIDPVLWILAFAGAIFTAIRKDYFALLWITPFLIFHTVSTIIQHFHWIILLPIFCIASSVLISDVLNMIVRRFNRAALNLLLPLTAAFAIGIFGIASISAIITLDVNHTFFQMYAFIVEHLPESHKGKSTINDDKDVTVMGSNWMQVFSWVPKYIFDKEHNFKTFSAKNLPLTEEKVLLLVDDNDLKRYIRSEDTDKNFEQVQLYNGTKLIAEFREKEVSYDRDRYPYTSMHENRGIARGGEVEVRSNY
jgi:Dolichyl-phosphate-mannose-protein mannosyltransferase